MNFLSSGRRYALTLAMLVAIGALHANYAAAQTSADNIVGTWVAEDGSLQVEMFSLGKVYDARLLYGNRVVEKDGVTFKQDSKNPDTTLRMRSLKGIEMIKDLAWSDGKWTGGTLYDGSSGRTYRAMAEIKGGKLYLRGYVGTPVLGQTVIMDRRQMSDAQCSTGLIHKRWHTAGRQSRPYLSADGIAEAHRCTESNSAVGKIVVLTS